MINHVWTTNFFTKKNAGQSLSILLEKLIPQIKNLKADIFKIDYVYKDLKEVPDNSFILKDIL